MDLVTKVASSSGTSSISTRSQSKNSSSVDFSKLIAAGAKDYASNGPSVPKKSSTTTDAPKAETKTTSSKETYSTKEQQDYEKTTGSVETDDKEKLKSKTEEELSVMSSLMNMTSADLAAPQQVQLVTKVVHAESSSEPLISGATDTGNTATIAKEDLVPALGSEKSTASAAEKQMAAELAERTTSTGLTAETLEKQSKEHKEVLSAAQADQIKESLKNQKHIETQSSSSPNGAASKDTFGPTGTGDNGIHAVKPEVNTNAANTKPETKENTSSAQQAAAANAQIQNPSNSIPNTQTGIGNGETVTMRTSESTVADDLTRMLASRFPTQNGSMTIELDPQNLGKITINVTYENKHAAVTIAASNPKTLEMLSQNATAMANILEQKTGQQTTIFIPNNQQADWKQDMNPNDQHQSENAQQQQAKQQNNNNSNQSSQSFLQQMRLGLA